MTWVEQHPEECLVAYDPEWSAGGSGQGDSESLAQSGANGQPMQDRVSLLELHLS
ncbi:hypothetical protein [Ornithinimicrobium sp. Y1694]|uniref:hypothetical protein n=1 Tax=Ornithinimicrobium sp. Y1694 TaxID=3418590 RepID=UPI003CF2AEB0